MATTYADRPWTKRYDPGVPATLQPYPQVPVQHFLQEAAKRHPDNTVLITSAKLPVLGRQAANLTYGQLELLCYFEGGRCGVRV
jgi:hypothetical protein